MTDPIAERRQTSRASAVLDCRARLGASLPVQILEISLSGVLLGSKTALALGERAEFTLTVGSRPLRVAIAIRHVSIEQRSRGGPRYRLGAAFVGMTAAQRLVLSELLGSEPN